MNLFDTIQKSAVISPCGLYRYELRRVWNEAKPILVAFMLNPSDADAEYDDRTVKKVCKFARAWGYGGVVIINFYAWRSPDPDELLSKPFPVAPPYDPRANDRHVAAVLAEAGDGVALAAWGGHKAVKARLPRVRELLAESGVRLVCLRMTKDGMPWHPLYVPDAQTPIEFQIKG